MVVADALAEGRVSDLCAMIGVQIRQFSGGILQVLKQLGALYHLLDGERGEEVVVDAVQAVRVLTGVALGPFLGIADGTHATEIHARDQVCCILLFDEI